MASNMSKKRTRTYLDDDDNCNKSRSKNKKHLTESDISPVQSTASQSNNGRGSETKGKKNHILEILFCFVSR